ncbi:hypothetical protein TRIUR3_08420 [Triticum urartu]|uniref:Uncharacterized protein n=1 Tax=Triticum urartu TaxID=4572 RepID=M8A080_TRIUA|nr:hypothetical protein TRIUR3_08420 [Triticum urartu]
MATLTGQTKTVATPGICARWARPPAAPWPYLGIPDGISGREEIEHPSCIEQKLRPAAALLLDSIFFFLHCTATRTPGAAPLPAALSSTCLQVCTRGRHGWKAEAARHGGNVSKEEEVKQSQGKQVRCGDDVGEGEGVLTSAGRFSSSSELGGDIGCFDENCNFDGIDLMELLVQGRNLMEIPAEDPSFLYQATQIRVGKSIDCSWRRTRSPITTREQQLGHWEVAVAADGGCKPRRGRSQGHALPSLSSAGWGGSTGAGESRSAAANAGQEEFVRVERKKEMSACACAFRSFSFQYWTIHKRRPIIKGSM